MELRATALMSCGTWVAKCPRPWCVHADHYGPGPHTGRIGGLSRYTFHCLRCGLVSPADWPAERADIEAVLAQRPFPETRNWLPGETVHDLLVENATHGLIDPDPITTRTVLAVGNRLTDLGRALVSHGPLQIGA